MNPRDWYTTDYYAVLGIDRAVSASEVSAAFHAIALACHPDLHPGDAEAAARFRAANAANDVLGNPALRADYDRVRENASPPASGEPRPRPPSSPESPHPQEPFGPESWPYAFRPVWSPRGRWGRLGTWGRAAFGAVLGTVLLLTIARVALSKTATKLTDSTMVCASGAYYDGPVAVAHGGLVQYTVDGETHTVTFPELADRAGGTATIYVPKAAPDQPTASPPCRR